MKTEKTKLYWLYYLIFYLFANFIEPTKRFCFCLIEDLTENLAIGRAKSKRREVIVSFFG